jgi:hypothetical protein
MAWPQVWSTAVTPISAPSHLGVSCNGLQGLGRDPHQQCIDDRLVLEGDLSNATWQRKDHMEIGDRQQIGDASIDPFLASSSLTLWANDDLRQEFIRDAGFAALIAGIDVTAKPGCPAGLDRSHDASFTTAKMTGVLPSVRATMPPKDVGDFEGGTQPATLPAESPPIANGQGDWRST